MKNLFKILLMSVLLISVQACNENDDNEILVQDHDQNQMMQLMHDMMSKMMAMQMTQDPDNDFAVMMRVHHQGAIDMANLELQSGNDASLKQLAQSIIDSQQQEIGELTAFLDAHPPHLAVPEFDAMQMTNMEKGGRNADLQIINGNTDHDFATLMIGHHQTAVENSRLELLYGHEPAMRTMASKIIESQEKEIRVMQDWLLANRKE